MRSLLICLISTVQPSNRKKCKNKIKINKTQKTKKAFNKWITWCGFQWGWVCGTGIWWRTRNWQNESVSVDWERMERVSESGVAWEWIGFVTESISKGLWLSLSLRVCDWVRMWLSVSVIECFEFTLYEIESLRVDI